jgi:TolA-binding protein
LVIEHYPIGVYAPNAYYWIGEVHAAKPEPDYEAARQALVQVIKSYPDSNKVPDAAFKLGKVYHLMGDCQRAKASLSDVAKTYSTKSAGKLAERYVLDQIAC